jgi:hypothetical protein
MYTYPFIKIGEIETDEVIQALPIKGNENLFADVKSARTWKCSARFSI